MSPDSEMADSDSTRGMVTVAAVGACCMVLACGLAQDAQSDFLCTDVDPMSPFADVIPTFEVLLSCAEEGHALAQWGLGLRYYNGDGVAEDPAEALGWFGLAADQGLADVQNILGMLYDDGRDVPEDDVEEAVRWYRLAADQGHAEAQRSLGTMYRWGRGIPEDLVLAYMWYDLAAAQGNDGALGTRDIVEQLMTSEQVAEAQGLSREWVETFLPDGGA